MQYYLKALKNYTNFTGRATRSEFWYFVLFNIIFAIVARILDGIAGTTFTVMVMGTIPVKYGYIYILYGLAVFIPGLALAVRRLHDVGKSGWFWLIVFIPIIGWIWLLVLYCTDTVPGDNQYGPNPKAEAATI